MQKLPTDTKDYLAPARKQAPVIGKTDTVAYSTISKIGFTYGGHPSEPCKTCEADAVECLAIEVKVQSERGVDSKYYVKGDENGNLFDPWNLLSEKSTDFDRLKGKGVWDFKEVKNKPFELYKTFLKTRNQLWKRHAEKEVKNA